jgi:hypothetical protein
MKTYAQCKSQFCLPKLEDKMLLEYKLHVSLDLAGYDMIIRRDILEDLGFVIDFDQKESQWGHCMCPFKEHDATIKNAYYIWIPIQ